MTTEQLLKTLAGAVAGVLIGWTGSALTLSGRVDAIEHTLARIEAHIDRITPNPAKEQKP